MPNKTGNQLICRKVPWFMIAMLALFLSGCSGEEDKIPSPSGPNLGAEVGSTRPDDDVLNILGVKQASPDDGEQATGLRIEVHEPKFDESKQESEATPPPKRVSPLDF